MLPPAVRALHPCCCRANLRCFPSSKVPRCSTRCRAAVKMSVCDMFVFRLFFLEQPVCVYVYIYTYFVNVLPAFLTSHFSFHIFPIFFTYFTR
jgi:hypothetical protein